MHVRDAGMGPQFPPGADGLYHVQRAPRRGGARSILVSPSEQTGAAY